MDKNSKILGIIREVCGKKETSDRKKVKDRVLSRGIS